MAAQLKPTHHDDVHTFNPGLLESEPLKLYELLNLIMLANEFGYTVKSAHDLKSGNNPILADIYSVWFAIENELLIFAHNIPRLIEFSRMKYSGFSLNGH